ncbi:hypothetical protein BBJ28_00006140 [Nothophytophthora sp. Chile5]|nr:hypothetical protein BBJ28_00006140 [Nothophytophthora sp. Chile5]
MGGGVSRRALLQRSDSRLEAILAESRKHADNDSAFALPLGKVPVLRVEVGSLKRPASGRMQAYSSQGWCQERTSSLREFDLPVSEDVASREQQTSKEGEEEEEDGYSTDDFEDDEIMKWKKGGSIGAGSYGTVRLLYLLMIEMLGCQLIDLVCADQVYLARDEETGSLMAVKEILISEESEMDIHEATREVELLRGLRHEHIVKYLGCHIDNEAQTLSIFTEWVPGGSLEHNRKLFGGNERVVRRFTHQLLSGVAYLHSKSIIHQDIKVRPIHAKIEVT